MPHQAIEAHPASLMPARLTAHGSHNIDRIFLEESADQIPCASGRKIRPFRAIRKAARHLGGLIRDLSPPAADRGYMICATPRSGSNYLSQLLAGTGVLGNPREYFNAPGRRHYDDPEYPESPDRHVHQILTTGRTPNGIYAVKVHHFQLASLPRNIDPTHDLPHLHYVVLQRRDLIGQAISWSRAQQTGQHRATDRSQQACRYDADHIRNCLLFVLDQRKKWKGLLRDIKAKPLVLQYESLLRDPQGTVNRVAALLRITEPAIVNSDLVTVTIQRDGINSEWRTRFLADTGDEFRHLL
jgi:trehalose 2-sulfotransferase